MMATTIQGFRVGVAACPEGDPPSIVSKRPSVGKSRVNGSAHASKPANLVTEAIAT